MRSRWSSLSKLYWRKQGEASELISEKSPMAILPRIRVDVDPPGGSRLFRKSWHVIFWWLMIAQSCEGGCLCLLRKILRLVNLEILLNSTFLFSRLAATCLFAKDIDDTTSAFFSLVHWIRSIILLSLLMGGEKFCGK